MSEQIAHIPSIEITPADRDPTKVKLTMSGGACTYISRAAARNALAQLCLGTPEWLQPKRG